MLEEEHSTPLYDTHYNKNIYICGIIHSYTIIITTYLLGETGNVNARRLTGPMFKRFSNIRIAALVSIRGGIPCAIPPKDSLDDIHLGDVMIGWPDDGKPPCV
jgi:hypothetical protein